MFQMVRFDSSGGWCGNVPRPGHNWVQIDLRAPTVIRGFRIQVVVRSDGAMAYPVSLRIHFTDDLTDAFHVYSDPSGRVSINFMCTFLLLVLLKLGMFMHVNRFFMLVIDRV